MERGIVDKTHLSFALVITEEQRVTANASKGANNWSFTTYMPPRGNLTCGQQYRRTNHQSQGVHEQETRTLSPN